HGCRPEAEIVDVILEDPRRAGAAGQVRGVYRNDLCVPSAGDAKHVQSEDESIVVVAEVSRIVGIESGFGGDDLVELPMGSQEIGRVVVRGDGEIKSADVRVEVHILIADDETSDLLVVGDDGIRKAGAGISSRQATRCEEKIGKFPGDDPCVTTLGG